jgi:hypothetical protein
MDEQVYDQLAVMKADIREIKTILAERQPSVVHNTECIVALKGRQTASEHRLETHDGDIRELKSFNDRHRDKFAIAGFLVAVASSALTALIVKLIMR